MTVAWLARFAVGVCLLVLQDHDMRAAEERLAAGDCAGALQACLALLQRREDDAAALALTARVLHDPRHVADAASERAFAMLARHPATTRATLVPAGEPGERLLVRGTVRGPDGAPLAGVHLRVFQADASGVYTPTRAMDEPHARLFAYVVTAADGGFELTTVRPGGYPGTPERQGLEWEIPGHVHFELEHAGHASKRFQLVFADDPRMQPEHWREWAAKGGHPVVTLAPQASGVLEGELEIVLEPAR